MIEAAGTAVRTALTKWSAEEKPWSLEKANLRPDDPIVDWMEQ